MANTLELGNGKWATGKDTVLAFNDENNNFKPLPFSFSRASSATVVNKEGLIETVGSGEPRIDFKDNTKGALLLEPERMNLVTNSELLNTWFTTKSSGAVITDNYGIAPNGLQNSSRIQLASSDYCLRGLSLSTNSTSSVYVKGIIGETIQFGVGANIAQGGIFTFNGFWQRIEYTYQNGSGSILFSNLQGSATATDFEAFGLQVEDNVTYATSYIPTSGSAVTRVAESSKIVNSPILQATNQFTLFFDAKDFVNYGATFANIMLTLGAEESPYDAGTGIHIYNKVWYYFNGSSAVTLGNCYNAITDSKFAISYDGTKYTRYANGVKLGTNTVSASMSNWDTITNGSLSYSSVDRVFNIADLKLYNTALTDQELQALTQ